MVDRQSGHPVSYGSGLARALAYALRVHRDQRRKGSGLPYAGHLLAVTALVIEADADEAVAMAAALHDTLEDQPQRTGAEELEREFGPRVAGIVLACTDGEPGEARGRATWEERRRHHLETMGAASDDARLVMLADKLHNARSLVADLDFEGPAVWDRFNAGPARQRWYYRALLGAFRAHPPEGGERLLEEFAAAVEVIDPTPPGPAAPG